MFAEYLKHRAVIQAAKEVFIKLLYWLILRIYRVEVHGLEHYRAAKKRVLIISNHASFLDGLLLGLFLSDRPSFAVNTRISQRWIFRPFLSLANIFIMDPTNPFSLRSLIRHLKKDHRVVIFPEGRITVTGSLMKIYPGPAMVADRSDAEVLPIRIEGAQYTPFSRLRGYIRIRWFPKITISILPAQRIKPPIHIKGRERRNWVGKRMSDIMTDMMFATSNYKRTLLSGVLDAMHIHGGRYTIAEDTDRKPINYRQLIAHIFILGKKLKTIIPQNENVGIFMPTLTSTAITLLGLHAFARVPAMLNYTSGDEGMIRACETAKIRTVLTSSQFINRARLEGTLTRLREHVTVYYLEDLVNDISLFSKFVGWMAALLPRTTYRRYAGKVDHNDPAVILFTSGSEGSPRGVVLSHANLFANYVQITARTDYNAEDLILNTLPMFHAFGLTAGTLLPLLSGVRVFFYPTPLHFRIIPEMAYDIGATILFGTDTFLNRYARVAHPYDFYTIRYVFSTAEKLQPETYQLWIDKFGVRILEGYATTETGPVLATNTSMDNKRGSVGRMLPGIEYYQEDVSGPEEGKRLFVKGPNIMLGYLLHSNPGVLIPPVTDKGLGWHDTGDIISMDDQGFISVLGRHDKVPNVK